MALRSAWKAVAAFAVVFFGKLIDNLVSTDGSVVLPQTRQEWLGVIGVSAAAAVAVYVFPNRYTKVQTVAHVNRLDESDQRELVRAKLEKHPDWT